MPGDKPQRTSVKRIETLGALMLSLEGTIDEHFDRRVLVEGVDGVVVLDLDGVSRITSYGVREWVMGLREQQRPVWFVRCRPALVSQFNMVEGFAGRGELLSLYAPYLCPNCGTSEEKLLDVAESYDQLQSMQPPPFNCAKCHQPLEFDDLPESYFGYVASRPRPVPPPIVRSVMAGKAMDQQHQAFRVRKEITGNITAFRFLGSLDQKAHFKRLADGVEGQALFLADGLTSADDAGLERLEQFVRELPSSTQTARMPIALTLAFEKRFELKKRAELVSVVVPFKCPNCGASGSSEFDTPAQERITGLDVALPCPACSVPGKVYSREDLDRTRRVLLRAATGEVRFYLNKHPLNGPPRQEERPRTLTPDTIEFGRYVLEKKLGMGGMAEVYLARQTSIGGFVKQVVVKRILPHLSSEATFLDMFFQEARLAAQISHPNVVQIFDFGQIGWQYFIAMEYVKGWDLNTLLRAAIATRKMVPIQMSVHLAAELCAGLHAAHICTDAESTPLNIVHRDVSPHNVLLSLDGQVKISDFGIAKAAGSTAGATPTHSLRGKVAFLAPELFNHAEADARTDIYAAGLVLYQSLTLQNPVQRNTELATLMAAANHEIPPASTKRQGLPPALDRIIAKATAKDRLERYATAAAFKEDLELFAADLPRWTPSDTARWCAELMKEFSAEQSKTIANPVAPPPEEQTLALVNISDTPSEPVSTEVPPGKARGVP